MSKSSKSFLKTCPNQQIIIVKALKIMILEGYMGLVDEERKESGSKEQYDLLWSQIVEKDEAKRQAIIEKMNFLLLSRHQKINFHLKKFKTPLLWIVPLCSISIVLLLYVVFILAALWTE